MGISRDIERTKVQPMLKRKNTRTQRIANPLVNTYALANQSARIGVLWRHFCREEASKFLSYLYTSMSPPASSFIFFPRYSSSLSYFSLIIDPTLTTSTESPPLYLLSSSFPNLLFHGLLPLLTMAIMRSFLLNSFLYLSLLLFHLGCFFFPTTDRASNKKRKVVVSVHKPHNNHKRLSSSWSFFKRIFSSSNTQTKDHETLTLASARSSQHSIVSVVTPADTILSASTPTRKRRNRSISISSEPDISLDHPSFPLRNDIFPCPTCGEIFQKTQLLEQHQVNKHAVSELFDGDSGKNIVQIIFKSGWNETGKNNSPEIHRILKIHNSPKILARFEEYRESVKTKASRLIGARKRDERCIADGNELLRFHCTTFMCNLGQNGNSSLCAQQYCSVCGIIRSGFSAKVDGISTLSNSRRAHVALPDELEQEFAFMNVKRAMLICRVVAGRIGNDQGLADKEDVGFDSVVGRGESHGSLDEDELLVFNPRAVLPCFAIVYSVPA